MSWSKAQELEFGTMLFAMGEAFNDAVSKARAELYCRALEDLPFEAVMLAANQHIRQATFFPKPAELRNHIEGNVEDRAELAWVWMLGEIRRIGYIGTPMWPDENTKRTVEGLFGSWRALCERLPGGGPELLGYHKQFVALFGATTRKAATGELGPGREEARTVLEGMPHELPSRGLPHEGVPSVVPFEKAARKKRS